LRRESANDLEGERRERLVDARRASDLVVLQVLTEHGRQVERRRQELDDGVEHRLHALFLKADRTAPARLERDRART